MTPQSQTPVKALIVDPRPTLATLISHRLNESRDIEAEILSSLNFAELARAIESHRPGVLVFSPLSSRDRDFVPDLIGARMVFEACTRACVSKVVLISSAMAYGADYHNPGLVDESRRLSSRRPNRVAGAWRDVETLAAERLAGA